MALKNKFLKAAAEKMPLLIKELEKLYPNAACSLNYETPFQLLISTQLSAQCTDARVNLVTPALFARFPDAESFASADVAEIEELIRSSKKYKKLFNRYLRKIRRQLARYHGGAFKSCRRRQKNRKSRIGRCFS